MTNDPRIDALSRTAILTDTQLRVSFAPKDEKRRVIALGKNVPAKNVEMMQSLCSSGTIHLQIKAGFGAERHVELTLPELMLIVEMADRFVTGLPMASRSEAGSSDA